MLEIPITAIININNRKYQQVTTVPKKGDRILDLRDGCHGRCLMKHRKSNHIVVGPDIPSYMSEVGVPVERVRKLVLIRNKKN